MKKIGIFENPGVGCVIMASGISKRFGEDKLLAEFRGKTFIEHALDITGGTIFVKRVVVTRSVETAEICKALGVEAILHEYSDRSDAVRLGVEQMQEIDACLFCPCDQPLLSQESIGRMIDNFSGTEDEIIRLGFGDRQGAPILFGKAYFEELGRLPEKCGGSHIAKQYPEKVRIVCADNEYELYDVDTKEDLEALKNQRM